MTELAIVNYPSIKDAQEAARKIGRLPSEYHYISLGDVGAYRDEPWIVTSVENGRLKLRHIDSEPTAKEKKSEERNRNKRVMCIRVKPTEHKIQEVIEEGRKNRAKYLNEKKNMDFGNTLQALKERGA